VDGIFMSEFRISVVGFSFTDIIAGIGIILEAERQGFIGGKQAQSCAAHSNARQSEG
jgi:hypothetical protein